MSRSRFIVIALAVAAVLLTLAEPARAQDRSISVSSGLFNFDLSGTGNAALVAASLDCRAFGNWVVEGGVTFAFPSQQFGDRTTFVIPEGALFHQWTRGMVVTFAGGGIGAAIDFRDDEFGGTETDLALFGGGGVRVNLSDSVGILGELRLRGFGTNFAGSATEIRGGASFRF